MALQVIVANATNLTNVETFGKSDPFAIVQFQGNSKKTEVKKAELNPVWDQTFDFDLQGQALTSSDTLEIFVKDWERVGRNRLLGTASVPLKEIARPGAPESLQLTVNLVDGNKRPTTAAINIKISYKPPPGAQPKIGGTVVDLDEEEDEEDEYDGAEKTDGEGDGQDAPDGATKTSKKHKKKRRHGTRKVRQNLSNKAQDFQIRLKIVEARQLPGANISPVARVKCYNQIKQTRILKSTSSPFWGEVFFFNFFCSPAELFDQLITFGVYNSRSMRSDAFIGSFKCDIGMVHESRQHSFINKWLLLSDPDDTLAGAKGYLKICASVLGPGNDAPSFASTAEDDNVDIEANLLRPAGVMLRPATFKLKLYRAEDIPRMDSDFIQGVKSFFGSEEKKELVDPYFVFSFAGKEVRSKIMYNNDHPEWNQELRLALRFPSMCERIKLQMFDWDRVTEDDACCTARLCLTHLSRCGDDGFLPTFGPCYVNFYGSPREFTDLPDEYEDLNLGKGEGVAFRGRALVELETILGELPETPVEEMLKEDTYKIQKFMRRRKFKLHAVFMNATMISAVDAPIEFEVSIGNYGNKLDESIAPCASTTPPTNAVFDGCHYYLLPWGQNRPCVAVDSHWEDVRFRLEALNLITSIARSLEENLEKVRVGQKANLSPSELAKLMISLLDQLVLQCGKPLPMPIEGQQVANKLDHKLRGYRQVELKAIQADASHLRENARDINEAISEVENYLAQLQNMAAEPQNSIPDVSIWMISGNKRVAYYRAPAHTLLWSPNPDYRGYNCGKLEMIALKYPGEKTEKDNRWEIPALLRVKLWLGLEKHEAEWRRLQTDGDLAVFAETYENQVSILGNWTNKGPTLTRPKFSDATGKIELNKESFVLPSGWKWVDDWYISPEISMLYDRDAGHKRFLEDVYECHSRYPAGGWAPASVPWADVKGDAVTCRDETVLPDGWDWEDEWLIDLNRAVDEEGWEYTVEATMGGYGPVEKRYHMCRRRRWVRMRLKVKETQLITSEEHLAKEAADGWEYAPLFNMKFHHKDRKMDLVRRRRWHRKMIAEDENASCSLELQTVGEDGNVISSTTPRMFLHCSRPNKYQLRAYIYQARDLLAGDSNGLSDPFARVCFMNQSGVTEKLQKTLCPTWDQTLLFDEIEINGPPKKITEAPPQVVIEMFDFDKFGSAEFLGRTTASPVVCLNATDSQRPLLQWFDIYKGNQAGGQLLAAFELFQMNGKDLPFEPPKRGSIYQVPSGIRPILQRTAIEVMCWGVRNMKKFQLSSVTSPSIEMEVGGRVVQSKVIKNTKRNPNFDEPLLFFDIMLPKEELYTPPLNIWVRDNRQFGRKPVVGVHVVKCLERFRCEPRNAAEGDEMDGDDAAGPSVPNAGGQVTFGSPNGTNEHVIDVSDEKAIIRGSDKKGYGSDMEPPVDDDIDWWSKYYASIGEMDKCKQYLENGYSTIEVYPTELEKVACFKNFDDYCVSFALSRGKSVEEEESSIVGEFKGTFRVYPLPEDPSIPLPPAIMSNLPSSAPEDCIVRVYVIRATDLQPSDPSGLADPYVSVRLGNHKADSKDSYVPNSLNPIFGKMFELKTRLPLYKDLIVGIKDYDLLGSDDDIGETVIDLENRLLTHHMATVGLPKTFNISGPNEWRNSELPKDILQRFCDQHHLQAPVYNGSRSVRVGKITYNLSDYEAMTPIHSHIGSADQRLALHVLHTLSATNPLVPEHVETRPLYNPLQPGIEQGKLQMWVDIFPASYGPPGPPVDVESRKPRRYEVRVVIWNTYDVILEEESITGEKMSDIYVKGWVAGTDDTQETDVHYRSLDGEGNFNWRFKFPLEYMPAEESIVIKRKEHFWSLDETELHLPPVLMIQVWDNDKFSADDFLGTLEMNLNQLPKPSKKASTCSLDQLPNLGSGSEVKVISLFEQKRIRGFWPCYNDVNGQRELTGKVEIELELLTQGEVAERPAGLGRDEPNQHPVLIAPKRPETSFLWFTSPLKTLRYIIWRNYKWWFIGAILIILLIIFIVLFIYAMPGAAVDKMFG